MGLPPFHRASDYATPGRGEAWGDDDVRGKDDVVDAVLTIVELGEGMSILGCARGGLEEAMPIPNLTAKNPQEPNANPKPNSTSRRRIMAHNAQSLEGRIQQAVLSTQAPLAARERGFDFATVGVGLDMLKVGDRDGCLCVGNSFGRGEWELGMG